MLLLSFLEMRKLGLKVDSLSRAPQQIHVVLHSLFLFVCFLKEWVGQTIFNDFQDAFVVDLHVVPEG